MALLDFTNEELRRLRDAINLVLGDREGSENRDFQEDPLHMAPETYVALVPDAGIPALSDITGTGGDSPGSATCSIFKVDANGDLVGYGFTKTVYNTSTTAIDDTYVPVTRTKGGKWVAVHCCSTS
jgi:hypothetical protein